MFSKQSERSASSLLRHKNLPIFSTLFLSMVCLLFAAGMAQANTYYSDTGQSRTWNITTTAGTHTFIVNGIVSYRETDWYVNGSFIRTDISNLGNLYWDPTLDRNISGTTTIVAKVYNSSRTLLETHTWNVTVAQVTSLSFRNSSGSIISQIEAGQTVYLRADATGMNGQTINVELWEDDGIGDDKIITAPITIGSSGYGTYPWPSVWQQNDGDTPINSYYLYYSPTSLYSGTPNTGHFLVKDTVKPHNPDSYTSTPPANTWSNRDTITVTWSGAYDNESGLDGYSVVWSQSPTTVPDTTKDQSGNSSITSYEDGVWKNIYCHVRAVDKASPPNWADGALHCGPFNLDREDPGKPTQQSPSNEGSVSTLRPTLTWSAASDGYGSGVAKYHLKVFQNWGGYWDKVDKDVEGTSYTLSESEALEWGKNYGWRLYAIDNVGNSGDYTGNWYFTTVTPSSLSGTVTNSRTTSAIAGASVSISPISNPFELTTPTLSNGSYSFTNIPADTYTLSVSKEGYRVYSGSVDVSGNTTKNVSLTPYVTISTFGVIPTSIHPGGRLTVTYYLSNSSSSSQTVWLGASVKRNGTTDWLDDTDNDKSVSVPGGASSYQVSRYFDIKPEYATGDYDIRVSIWQSKQGGLMVERYDLKEPNNAFTVIPAADLAVMAFSMSWPAGDPRGQHPTGGSFTITNNGPSNVVNGSYRIDFYLSTDSTITTSDRKMGDNGVALTINSGQTVSGEITSTGLNFVTIPSDMPVGTYYVGMHLVPLEGAPTDPQDNNNWRADGTVTIAIIETVWPPTSITGPSEVVVNTDNEFTASGASSSLGHTIEYRIDKKGDGSDLTGWRSDGKFNLSWSETRDYNLKAQARCSDHTDKESSWSEILKMVTVTSAPSEWSFVQISDTHIGASWVDCLPMPLPEGGYGVRCGRWDARTNLAVVLHKVLKKVKPAFIVNTGDVADYGCTKGFLTDFCWGATGSYRAYSEVIDEATKKGVRVYSIAGNHDQRNGWPHNVLCNNFPSCFMDPRDKPDPDSWFIGGRSSFLPHDDDILFVTLNTDSRCEGVQCNCQGALTEDDINFLNTLNADVPKIILTHHPAVAGESDRLGIAEWCPTFGLDVNIVGDDFLKYCEDKANNVLAVLSGHTHTSREYDRNLGTPTGHPKYIITGSAGKVEIGKGEYPVFRKIDVIGSEITVNNVTQLTKEDYYYIWYENYSPTNLHVYDSNWRHTGYDPVNGYERGIPDSVYFSHYVVEDENGIRVFPEKVMIFDPCDNYLSRLVGTETGSYRLGIGSIKDGNEVVFEANDIPSLPGAVHDYVVNWKALSQDQNDQNAVTIVVDQDGDGEFEKTIISDSNLTGDEFVSEWPKLDDYVTIQVGEAGYDHQKKRLGVNVTVTNTSGKILGVPLWVVVESVSEPNITLADANGVTSKDKNYADLSELLLNDPNRKLDPGESITKRIYFNNPDEVRFTFKPSVRGVILSQGEGTGFGNLSKMSQHWLGDEPALDVAPLGGDGIINLRDFAVLAERWLDF